MFSKIYDGRIHEQKHSNGVFMSKRMSSFLNFWIQKFLLILKLFFIFVGVHPVALLTYIT
jgi:hypothetical protein